MCEGITAELEGIDLGDKRLNKRSVKLIETPAADPQASINAACDGWSDTIAAYRFFDNESVEPSRILQPHIDVTKRRMSERSVVLMIQGTTEFDFTPHPPEDARCLNNVSRFGFYVHTHPAVTPEGLCLGVVGPEQFDRAPKSLGKTDQRSKLPCEEKESLRRLSPGVAVGRANTPRRGSSASSTAKPIFTIFSWKPGSMPHLPTLLFARR